MSALALIIEDDEDLADIYTEALRGAGYEVEQVSDGRIAQARLLDGEPPFIVLLDMHIPYISGGDLLTYVIKEKEHLAETKVILTTADARMGAIYSNMADYILIKPISFMQLRNFVSYLKSNR